MSGDQDGSRPAGDRAPRLSPARVAVALVLVLGVSGGGALGLRERWTHPPEAAETWFAPYVDVTLTPSFAFEDPAVNPTDDVVLGFVVADPDDACTPTWGAAYDLDAAARDLDLDRRVARLRDRGGDVVVSFGGLANDELAVACTDVDALAGAYRDVVDRYTATTIDLDVEGDALDDRASVERRATAVAAVQASARGAGRELAVWLTLPVTPDGLTATGVAVVDAMLSARVDLGGVNVMTMNYGASRPEGTSMAEAAEQAVGATRDQMDEAYRRAGTRLDGAQLWGKVGATPMIGVNDVPGETVTVADAQELRGLARRRGLGRVSMWSANRDSPCPPSTDTSTVSNTCSGVSQDPLAFSRTFAVLPGRPEAHATRRTVARALPADDPTTSPYPVWEAAGTYTEGDKVVRHGEVWVAQWWTQGDDPGAEPAEGQATPWRLVGPVLASDRRRPAPTLPAGTHPEWDPEVAYTAGDRVRHGGVGYRAGWWTRGDEPGTLGPGSEPSPWTSLPPVP